MSRQRGSSLLEVLVATGILATISVVFLTAMSSGLEGTMKIDEHFTAENLVRNQIEDIRNSPYSYGDFYPVTVEPPPEYSILIEVTDVSPTDYPDSLQIVGVSVSRGEKRVLKLETYKADL